MAPPVKKTPIAKPAAKPRAKVRTATKATVTKPKTAPKKIVKNTPAKRAPVKGKILTAKKNASDDVKNFKSKATDTARVAAERGKERASEAVNSIGKLIRDSAATIDENVGKNYGDYARNAADMVDGFANRMSKKDVDDIATDAREFVRKSPAVAIGAAAAIGFVIARLFRSSGDDA